MRNHTSLWLFLFGMFSMTQFGVIGHIGISEFVCFLAAPIVFANHYSLFKRDGFLPVIYLAFSACLGCIVSSWYNATHFALFARGFASAYSLFAIPVVLYSLLRNNLQGLKWIFIGIAISLIVNVFIFQTGFELSGYAGGEVSSNTVSQIMGGTLFWLTRVSAWLVIPVYGWYLKAPLLYLLVAPVAMSVHTVITTESGRSALITAVGTFVLILIGRKNIRTMLTVQRCFVIIVAIGILGAFAMKSGYVYLASNGYLNEKATKKYHDQSRKGTGMLDMLIGGRVGFFAGLGACADNPIFGYGPWARDTKEYYREFLMKYGDSEDYERYEKAQLENMLRGGFYSLMPSHSHIVGFWISYGILGLPFWLYILWCMIRHFRRNMAAIPHWYGYFAYYLPLNLWHVFFSPYGNRIEDCVFVTCLCLANAVRVGKVSLPFEMHDEACKHS